MEEFKPGDVVVLKSGGPKMTVFSHEKTYVYAVWFSGDAFYEKEFKDFLLAKVDYTM